MLRHNRHHHHSRHSQQPQKPGPAQRDDSPTNRRRDRSPFATRARSASPEYEGDPLRDILYPGARKRSPSPPPRVCAPAPEKKTTPPVATKPPVAAAAAAAATPMPPVSVSVDALCVRIVDLENAMGELQRRNAALETMLAPFVRIELPPLPQVSSAPLSRRSPDRRASLARDRDRDRPREINHIAPMHDRVSDVLLRHEPYYPAHEAAGSFYVNGNQRTRSTRHLGD